MADDRAEALQAVLSNAGDLLLAHFREQEVSVLSPAPFEEDLAASLGQFEPPARQTLAYAGVLAAAVDGHLKALAYSIGDRTSLFAPLALSRVAGEGCAYGWWLLEEGLPPIVRAERTWALRVNGLSRTVRTAKELGMDQGWVERQQGRLERALSQAKHLGLPVHEQEGVVVGLRTGVPGAGQLHGEIIRSCGIPLNGGLYDLMSGVIHSSPVPLMTLLNKPESSPTGVMPMAIAQSDDIVEHAALFALAPATAYARRLHLYLGHPTDTVDRFWSDISRSIISRSILTRG